MAQNFYNTSTAQDSKGLVPIDQFLGSSMGMEDTSKMQAPEERQLIPVSEFLGDVPDTEQDKGLSFYEGLGLSGETEPLPVLPEDDSGTPAWARSYLAGQEKPMQVNEEILKAGDTEDINKDRAKFAIENVAEGASSLADLFGWATYSKVDEAVDRRIAEATGKEYDGRYTYKEATETAIKSFYQAVGEEPELQPSATSFPGKVAEYTLENVGASGLFGGIFSVLSKMGAAGIGAREGAKQIALARGPVLPSTMTKLDVAGQSVKNFLLAEGKVSVAGGIVGGAFWTQGSSEEQAEQLGALGNLIGSLAGSIAHLTPTGMSVNAIRKLKRQVKNTDEFWEKHDKHILGTLARLVPEDQLPKLQQRIEDVRKIQTLVPEFKPSVGNLIDTNEARQIQSIIDTANFESASAQYRINKDAIESLVREVTEVSDPAQKEIVASALRMLRKESIFEADRLRSHIDDLQQQLLARTERGSSLDETGQRIKDQLLETRELYDEHVDNIYKAVDPEGVTRFDVTDLKSAINSVITKGGLGENITRRDDGYTYITRELPDYLNSLSSRAGKGPSMAEVFRMPQEPQTISYEELYNVRKAVGKEAARIRRANTGSRVPDKLDRIVAVIDDITNNKMTIGDSEMADRHFTAIETYRELYAPRFGKDSMAQRFLRIDGNDVPNDQVARTLWNTSRTTEDSNINRLREIFEQNELKIEDPLLFETAKKEVYGLVEDFAIEDLGRTLRNSFDKGGDSIQAFNNWKTANKTRLDVFPEIRKSVDEIGQELSLKADDIGEYLNRIEDLTANVIEKYSKVDSTAFVRDLVNKDPLQVRIAFRDILSRNNLMADFDPELVDLRNLDEMIEAIPSPIARREAKALRDAISENTVQFLLRRSMKTDGSGFDPKKLLSSMDGMDDYVKSESLNVLLNPKNRVELDMLRKASNTLGNEITPRSKIELDGITSFMNKFGVTIPSLSSRIYAQQLGKVGPVYIVADTFVRVLKGASDIKAQNIYRKVMYDLEGLEEIIRIRVAANAGDKAAIAEFEDAIKTTKSIFARSKEYLTDTERWKQFIIKEVNVSGILRGRQLEEYLDTVDKSPLEYDEGAMNFYLNANDKDTGQPSRINQNDFLDKLLGEELEEVTLPNITPRVGVEEQSTAPEGTPDGIWEDANGNRVRVEGGKVYGL